MGSPKVSVLMPVYNAKEYLAEAIESLLKQTLVDFELVIIDDCSKDGSTELVSQYSDPRIRLIKNEQNLGVARTLNVGLRFCRGEFIARMDADDVADPSRLERQYDFLDTHNGIDLVGADIIRMDSEGNELSEQHRNPDTWGKLKWLMFLNCSIAHPTIMARKSFFEKAGGYPIISGEDFALWHAAIDKGLRLQNLPMPLLRYRVHVKSISKARAIEHLEAAADVVRKHAEKRLGLSLDRSLAMEHLRLADQSIPLGSVAGLIPFYLTIARASFRDPQTTLGDTLFIWRRLVSRLSKGALRSLFSRGRATEAHP